MMTIPSQRTKRTAPSRRGAAATRLDLAVAAAAGISREQAQALILAGEVRIRGETQRKPGMKIEAGAPIELEARPRFASRGGYKLERALEVFRWSVDGLRCLDVGASTGGFTDCLLQRGAAHVTAVDVGYGHLAWGLRNDPRVRVVERANFRHADLVALGAPFAFICADVSFISIAKLASNLSNALEDGGRIVVLVKPQFEAGRDAVARGGVVKEPNAQAQAIGGVIAALAANGLQSVKLTYSPLKGPAGNIEFLLGGERRPEASAAVHDIEGVVQAAHEALDR